MPRSRNAPEINIVVLFSNRNSLKLSLWVIVLIIVTPGSRTSSFIASNKGGIESWGFHMDPRDRRPEACEMRS